jgi:hypothetical protein
MAPSAALVHSVVDVADQHILQTFASTCPSPRQVLSMKHRFGSSGFVHPEAVQVSAVQAFPSRQSCEAPPPVHWPATQVRAATKVVPLQEAAAQGVPSTAGLQAVREVPGSHARQGSEGFAWPAP